MSDQIYITKTPEETFDLGVDISKKLSSGDVIGLEGSLGAGKSVLIRGILSGLGIEEFIPSPTFTLVNEYSGKYKIFHFDFYRVNDPYELYEIGFEEYIYSKGISIIEWYTKGEELLPENMIKIQINIKGDMEREILIRWKS